MTDLMETVKGMMTSDAVGKAADQTGESPDNMRKATSGAISAVFAGLTHGTSTPAGATRIFGMLTQTGSSPQGLRSGVFGDRSGAVSDALARSSGVKGTSASHALSMALPLVFGALGKHVVSNRLNAGGMSELLSRHKKAVLDDPNTPPELAPALGMRSLSELGGASGPREPERVRGMGSGTGVEERVVRGGAEGTRGPWWAFLLPALLVAGLLVWGLSAFMRGRGPHIGVTAPQPTTPSLRAPEVRGPGLPLPRVETPTTPTTPTAPSPNQGQVALPGGGRLDVAPDSAEAAMAHDLGDSSVSLPRTFHFDRLNFDAGSTAVTPESAKAVDDLATMLRAYPSARVRVEGHTDVRGGARSNQDLSEARANAVKDMLVAKGIGPERIETSGEGAQRPAPGNEARELAPDRRADIVLLSR